MNLSNEIAKLMLSMFDENGNAEIRRNELAEQLGCVPSQINYVISSRFTPEHGYIVESRRGGGGYIKITRINCTKEQMLMHIVNAVGEEIDEQSARAFIINMHDGEILSTPQARTMLAAVNDNCYKAALPDIRQKIRAAVLKQMILTCI